MTNSQIYRLIENRLIEKRILNAIYLKDHNCTVKLSLSFAHKGVRAVLSIACYDSNNTVIWLNDVGIVDKNNKLTYSIPVIKGYLPANTPLNIWQQHIIEKYKLNSCGKTIPIEDLEVPADIEHLLIYELIKTFKTSNLGLILLPSHTLIINENESYEQLSIEADLMFYD